MNLSSAERCKRWRKSHPNHSKNYETKRRESLLLRGCCTLCGKRQDRENAMTCKKCAAKAKERSWKRKGITDATIKEYNRLLKSQKGLCAICKNPPKTRALSLDHVHGSGKIRGLLCFKCNYGLRWLEWFNRTPEQLQTALDYLQRNHDTPISH